jgi:SAM-dependent methyltransferase
LSKSLREFENNWSYELYVKHPELFLPILEEESKDASKEVAGLCKILRDLDLPVKAKILDLSCGIGRHCIPLAKRGFIVTGYDPSEYYINIARKRAESQIPIIKNKIRFYSGDPGRPAITLLRNKEKDFDVIVILFQSIGYISREYDLLMLNNLRKISASKSFLILETENRDWRLRNFENTMVNDYGAVTLFEKWKFDSRNNVFKNQSKFYVKTENKCFSRLALRLSTQMILYTLEELKEITRKAGWDYYRSYHSIRSVKPAHKNSEMPVSIYASF